MDTVGAESIYYLMASFPINWEVFHNLPVSLPCFSLSFSPAKRDCCPPPILELTLLRTWKFGCTRTVKNSETKAHRADQRIQNQSPPLLRTRAREFTNPDGERKGIGFRQRTRNRYARGDCSSEGGKDISCFHRHLLRLNSSLPSNKKLLRLSFVTPCVDVRGEVNGHRPNFALPEPSPEAHERPIAELAR